MFTEEQQAAIDCDADDVCVVAGAGAGKTQVVIGRIKRAIKEGVAPHNIVAFTFTRKAGKEMRDRLGDYGKGVRIDNMHALFFKELKRNEPNLAVMSDIEKKLLLREVAKSLGYYRKNKNGKGTCPLGSWDTLEKRVDGFRMTESLTEKTGDDYGRVAQALHSRMKQMGEIDFLGILVRGLEMINSEDNPFANCQLLVIDEAQDNDYFQWKISLAIKQKSGQRVQVFAVGDMRQEIYGWRGSRADLFYNRRPQLYITKTFRNSKEIVEAANNLIGEQYVPMVSDVSREPVRVTDRPIWEIVNNMRAKLYPPQDIAVLCRTNQQVAEVTKELEEAKLKVVKNQEPSDPDFCYDLLSTATRQSNDRCLKNLMGRMVFSDGEVTIDRNTTWLPVEMEATNRPDLCAVGRSIRAAREPYATVGKALKPLEDSFINIFVADSVRWWNRNYGGWLILDALNDFNSQENVIERLNGHVNVCTIHSSKGLEFPCVIVYGLNSSGKEVNGLQEEERRVYYVAMTRASEVLVLHYNSDKPKSLVLAECGVV